MAAGMVKNSPPHDWAHRIEFENKKARQDQHQQDLSFGKSRIKKSRTGDHHSKEYVAYGLISSLRQREDCPDRTRRVMTGRLVSLMLCRARRSVQGLSFGKCRTRLTLPGGHNSKKYLTIGPIVSPHQREHRPDRTRRIMTDRLVAASWQN
jgi:hypothetical protein